MTTTLRTVVLLLAAAGGSAFTPMRSAKLAPARSKVMSCAGDNDDARHDVTDDSP